MRELIAEFIGTFALILIGAGSVMLNTGLVAIALAHGLVIFVMATAFGKVSGGHVNPAVTIGVRSIGKMKWQKAGQYIASQLAGALVAAFVLLFLFGNLNFLGTPALAPNVGIGQGILIEAILTFFLLTVILNTAVYDNNLLAPLAIGMTIVLDILFGGPLTGAAMNPALAFGPAIASGYWINHLVYWVGPIIGAVAASLLARYMAQAKDNSYTQKG